MSDDLISAEQAQRIANNLAYSVLDVETSEELDPGTYAHLAVEDAKVARKIVLSYIAQAAEITRLRAQVEAADRAIAAIFDDVGYRPEDLGAEAQEVITAYQQAKESKE